MVVNTLTSKFLKKSQTKHEKTFAARFFFVKFAVKPTSHHKSSIKYHKLYRRRPYHPTPIPKNTPTPSYTPPSTMTAVTVS